MVESSFNDKLNNNVPDMKKPQGNDFHFGILPFDPLFVWISLIYGLTRLLEWIAGTECFWENSWIRFVDYTNANEHDFLVWVTSAAISCVFWSTSLAFLFLDLTGSLRRYKVQPGKNEPIELRKLIEAVFTVLFNQIIVSITFSSGSFWLRRALRGELDARENVPSFPHLMRDLLIAHQVFDIGFYLIHRLMHTKYLYKTIHKIHHEWKAPVGIIAIYAHPAEHLITNLIPAILGPALLHAHDCTIWIWLSTVAITTVSDHSGYHLPFLKSPEFHDHHHVSFTECFGTCGVMDFIFRTDTKFRQTINFQRHRVLLSFKNTIRELHPSADMKSS